MKRASAIVTNRGGRTCHAAIIARELGIPAVVGCGDATRTLRRRRAGHRRLRGRRHRPRLRGPARDRGRRSGARPDAAVPDEDHDERRQSRARVRVPPAAERGRGPRAARVHHQSQRRHPSEGAARVRPAAAGRCKREIERRIAGYASPTEFYVAKIAEGVATIAAAFLPKKVIVRLSDFKSNEYSNLVGGSALRAARGKSDARLSRRVALHRAGVLRVLRARMPGDEARARRHGVHERRADGAVRAHACTKRSR